MKNVYNKFAFLLLVPTFLIFGGCQFGEIMGAGDGGAQVWLDEGEVKGPTATLRTAKGDFVIFVEIADTSAERAKGLMYRESMKDNQGMFFVFDTEEKLAFWMKNTLIPLDMIFIDSNYKVVHVQKGAQPCKVDPCAVYPSVKPARYVLEVKAGTSERLGVKEGDTVKIKI